jgi:hypothetical protein
MKARMRLRAHHNLIWLNIFHSEKKIFGTKAAEKNKTQMLCPPMLFP